MEFIPTNGTPDLFFSVKDNELLDSNPGVRRIAHLRISPRETYGGLACCGFGRGGKIWDVNVDRNGGCCTCAECINNSDTPQHTTNRVRVRYVSDRMFE